MNPNTFIKIITLADLKRALLDPALYEKVEEMLLNLVIGEVLDERVKLVEDEALNQSLYALINETYTALKKNVEDGRLDKILNQIKKDENLYGELYNDLDDQQLRAKLRADSYRDDDESHNILDTALQHTHTTWLNSVAEDKQKLLNTLQLEASQRGNINYYLEVSNVLSWLDFEYYQCADSTKEFIKKHIDTIIESNHPNKTLERLQLFHFAQFRQVNSDRFEKFLDTSLEHLQAFEHLIGYSFEKFTPQKVPPNYPSIENIVIDNLNRKNINMFIDNPVFSSLKKVTKPAETVDFFTYLSALWWALVNKDNHSQSLITRVAATFAEIQAKRKEYKAYHQELMATIKDYKKIYQSGLNRLALNVLDESGEVKNDIDFMAVAKDLCALSYLYCFGITLVKKNPVMDKFFEKFNSLTTVDPVVKGKLEVLAWIYQGFYGNMDNAGKEFLLQHLEQIMACDRPKEALNALFFIYFYKLHDKTNSNAIIDAVLKSDSPQSFFKELMTRLVSLHTHPDLLKETEVNSVLDTLLINNEPVIEPVSEVMISAKQIETSAQNRPITAWCSYFGCKGHRSLDVDGNNNQADTQVKLESLKVM